MNWDIDLDKKVEKQIKWTIVAGVGTAVVQIAFLGACVYVAWHFISKYW